MAIFEDKELKKKVQYLEDERTKIWNRIVVLENENKKLKTQIIANASESAKDAAQSSRRAAEFRNKSEQRLNEANEKVGEINAKLQEANKISKDITNAKDDVHELKVKAEKIDEDYIDNYNSLKKKIDNLNEFLTEYPELDDKLEEIQAFIDEIDSNVNKSKSGLSTINLKRKEIEEFYKEVFGYFTKDEEDEEIRIDGLKQHLEDGFSELSDNIKRSEERVSKVKLEYESQFKNFEQSHKSRYEHINDEISSLLPAALTAGLSSAFSNKKEQEEHNSIILQSRFQIGIYMLIGASFIPFFVSIFLLSKGETFDQIIYKIPRLVLAIIPMYVPILWFTYSANKKLNLSKRLIEEYSHKEVLSKTYEGLSKQINNLESDEQTNELKYRLLSSFLQITSENPGKLISNYEASDHPVMEALEQSYRFQIAIDKLDSIPGLGKVAAIIESNTKKKLQEKDEKIKEAFKNVSEEN
jgi:chromosome segregation ATPase